jgi:hypothetical protein
MDDVARMQAKDRADLFAAAAAQRGLSPEIIEKDFWVCWMLKRLFAMPNEPAGLIFKGGTSLSKVYGAIRRFSEDVDLSFDRKGLGFKGATDPAASKTRKARDRSLDALSAKCRAFVEDTHLPLLAAAIANALRPGTSVEWALSLAGEDEQGQTVLFQYPLMGRTRRADAPAYIQPGVRLEFGARSEHWPAIEATVQPYAADELSALFKDPKCQVRVLAGERTFWEKATLLHMWHHAPADKHFRDRQSRHYYDVVCLYDHDVGRRAVENPALLSEVARHKSVFFPAAWARYDLAKPGSLRLVPPPSRLPELERDYGKMREMIFEAAPTFVELIARLEQIEVAINGGAGTTHG